MRTISESISYLVLLGALAIAFAATLVVVPRYFSTYSNVAVQAAYSQELQGYQTSASLTRVRLPGRYALIVIIYNNGDSDIRVSYNVVCGDRHIGGEEDRVVPSRDIYVNTFRIYTEDTCYLVVEEPGILIYKVVES